MLLLTKIDMDYLFAWSFCSFLLISIFTYVTGDSTIYRTLNTAGVQGTWGRWGPFLTLNARSKPHCAVLCSQNPQCDLAQFDPETSECHLHSEQNLVIFYPLTNGISTSTVMIGKPLNLVDVRPQSGGYSFDFTAADYACKALGGRLSTQDEMIDAYYAQWLHVGTCCWNSAGYAYYVLQYTVHGTGWAGINYCNWSPTWDAFCYIPGPEI